MPRHTLSRLARARALPGNKCGGRDYTSPYWASPSVGFVTSGVHGMTTSLYTRGRKVIGYGTSWGYKIFNERKLVLELLMSKSKSKLQ